MGIDHGNGNMKGVHVNFPCGLVRYTSEPGRFMNEDILEYNGVYYTLSETRMPFKADKTVDEDYFILTLFSAGFGIQKIFYGTLKTWNFFQI